MVALMIAPLKYSPLFAIAAVGRQKRKKSGSIIKEVFFADAENIAIRL